MLIKEESRHQAQFRQDIITGKKREPEKTKIWIPDVPESYLQFKAEYQSDFTLFCRIYDLCTLASSDSSF
jgi:hypothetical protein